jgi:hypothetical protein
MLWGELVLLNVEHASCAKDRLHHSQVEVFLLMITDGMVEALATLDDIVGIFLNA